MIPSEEAEQVALVQWLELIGLKFSAIPNSTYTTSWKVKTRNTRTGLRPGLPDLLIALPGTGLVFIELKRQKKGVVSTAQREWIETLNACPGVAAHVCKGFEEAKTVIESYKVVQPKPDTAPIF
jgi:hypothetical protein